MIEDPILDACLTQFAKEYEFTDIDRTKVFEYFANYCVVSRLYGGTMEFLEMETGGAFGIDGIAVIANDRIAFTSEEIEDISKNSLDAKFIFTQAKTSKSLNTGQLLQFFVGVNDFFEKSNGIAVNKETGHFRDLRRTIFERQAKMDSPPSCDLYYVYPGSWQADETVESIILKETSRLQSAFSFSNVRFVPVDGRTLKDYYKLLKRRAVKTFPFGRRVTIPKGAGVNAAFIGVVSAIEYLKLVCDTQGDLEAGLFYENIRGYLGDQTRVNKEIFQTIRESNEQDKFVLLNNGITIVAKKIVEGGDEVTIHDYQVVNGCQTSHAIYYNKEIISNTLYLPLKLISTDSQDLTNNIIKATNNQTEVKEEAFVALEPFHKRLEDFYNSFSNGGDRLYYERRARQYEMTEDILKQRVISLSIQTKAFVAMHLSRPCETSHTDNELINRYWKNADQMFQEKHDTLPYYICAFGLYRIERELRKGTLSPVAKSWKYHLLYLLRILCTGYSHAELLDGSKAMKTYCRSMQEVLTNHDAFLSKLVDAEKIVDECLNIRKKSNQSSSLLNSNSFTEAIRDLALKRIGKLASVKPPSTEERFVMKTAEAHYKRGTIKRVGPEFGFITDKTGEDLWFHFSNIRCSRASLKIGAPVCFTPIMGYKGWKAIDVDLDSDGA